MNTARRHSARRERGAALIVAIGVLTLLLVIALTFFRASLGDLRTAQNTADGVRAELMADGATAVAIGFLNHDRVVHPSYSSLDHAWKTYFNGAWAVGKPWLWAPLEDPDNTSNGIHRLSLLRGGVPEVEPFKLFAQPGLFTSTGAPNDTLYIPRKDFQRNGLGPLNPGVAPANYATIDTNGIDDDNDGQTDEADEGSLFVLSPDLADAANVRTFPGIEALFNDPRLQGTEIFAEDYASLEQTFYDDVEPNGRNLSLLSTPTAGFDNQTLPREQIAFFTDVDNDGDGLNDSMWLPIPADRDFPDDGLDNDLDGFRDELGADGIDQEIGDPNSDDDEDGEPGVFMYRGNTDGIDNDNDGQIDEDDEYDTVIFTVPYPFVIPVDTDNDGTYDGFSPVSPTPAEFQAMGIVTSDVRYEGRRDPNTGLYQDTLGYSNGTAIYFRDNDYDLVADQPADASHYMLTQRAVDALVNNTAYPYADLLRTIVDPGNIAAFNPNDPTRSTLQVFGQIRGETVCTIAGRMAILINDESAKVNLNTAGATSFDLAKETIDSDAPLTRSFNLGVGPHEYETRVIPFQSGSSWGTNTTTRHTDLRLGAPQGLGLKMNASDGYTIFSTDPLLTLDMSLPGYGRVDDNANLLELVLKGTDMDGDTYAPQSTNATLPDLLGNEFEGIDDPAEYQRFRPYRDIVAETNGADDDDDGVTDEIGEMGDTYYRSNQQIKNLDGLVGSARYEWMRNYISAHSSDRNDRHMHSDSLLSDFNAAVGRQTVGLRKDLNVTRPQDVAAAIEREWTYLASVPERRGIVDPADNTTPADLAAGGVLSVGGTALTDTDFGQAGTLNFLAGLRREDTTVTTSQPIMGLGDTTGENTAFTFMADTELRAHQVAANIKDVADRDYVRSVDDEIFANDYWWRALAQEATDADPGNGPLRTAAAIAQTQRIYYTTAGMEAIRINELNVRPVRRVEAEAITNLDATSPTPDEFRGLDPNRFVPHDGAYPPATQTDAEAIEEEGFRVRVMTTTDAIADYNARPATPPNNIQVVTTGSESDPQGQRWNLRPRVDRNGVTNTDAGLLGLSAAWATYRQYLTVRNPNATDPTRTFQVPDVVQFSIQATRELPAANYYVKLDVSYVEDGTGDVRSSADDTGDFLFAVKTGTREQDWFADVMNIDSYVEGRRVYGEAWRQPALLGSDGLGGSAGMAFLQGDAFFAFDPTVPAGSVITTTPDQFVLNNVLQRNIGFTIRVPDRTLPIPPVSPDTIDDDQWLHIAIRSMRPDGIGFVVNAIEFSQEPDHEWIEVTNESDETVDLSGWQLAVENHPLGIGPMTVPDGTFIAAKGMLLLGTNKFDYVNNVAFDPLTGAPSSVIAGDTSDPADPDLFDRGVGFFSNGIGLATGNLESFITGGNASYAVFAGVSVPQIQYWLPAVNPVNPEQGSEFEGYVPDRNAIPSPALGPADFVDYVDRDGDGEIDPVPTLPAVRPDDAVFSTIDPILVSGALPQSSTKPWDRIVELIIPDLIAQPGVQAPFTAADIGRIVLGGGIFPNRPEFDAWDNDGDNRILTTDNIDNDIDGIVDEPGEGRDEGRFTREEFIRDGSTPIPGAYNRGIVFYTSTFDPNGTVTISDYWTGNPENPPQWKEFLERRNFPGDNVIVTLYQGLAKNNEVADRATYTERDVENRQIDDIVPVNDFDLEDGTSPPFGEVAIGGTGVPQPLDDRFYSLWPENQMALDFARSLERKLPSYNGDRFGVRNRFQATDGAYDDWSDSAGRWERFVSDSFGPVNLIDRFFDETSTTYREFAHAVSGTPLRRNVATQYALRDSREEIFNLAEFGNRPLVSPGSALLAAHPSRTLPMFTDIATSEQLMVDIASPNVARVGGDAGRRDDSYDSALIGQRFDGSVSPINFFKDIRAFLGDMGTTDSISLNVGQATVIQVTRGGTSPDAALNESWPTSGLNLSGYPPQHWVPLMMFALPDDTSFTSATAPPFGYQEYGYERQYLFQTPGSIGVTNERWPQDLRTALYTSRNFNDFDVSQALDGAQAVFVWDGDDGLENGEYDLYVVASEDLTPLAAADSDLASGATPTRLLTDDATNPTGVGLPFVRAADRTANRELYFDVEAFRDVNGDRKAWLPDLLAGGRLADGDLNRGQALGRPVESFGQISSIQPDADGVIHYGVVSVQNNFLAVSLRNRSAAGTVARISRVILAARNKTPGRININTAETRRVAYDPANNLPLPGSFFNPLIGLPGMVERAADNTSGSFVADAAGFDLTDQEISVVPADNRVEMLARNIMNQRLRLTSERPDGRYYELTSDLLADSHGALLPEHPDSAKTGLAFRLPLIAEYDNYAFDDAGDGQIDNDDLRTMRPGALAEAAYRFRRMQNLITTRGDTYEILVTVQAGYGTDINGDGRINWRDDKEFTPTAEKTARTIYER